MKEFSFRWSEVGGFDAPFKGTLTVPTCKPLPFYVPTIYHGYRRQRLLPIQWAAVPLYSILGKRKDGTYGLVVDNGESLRQFLHLADTTNIIVTSVAPDRYLENFWRKHQVQGIADLLLSLDIQALTIPNFSFFLDAPPVHTLFNLARMLRVAERFSAVGLPLIPHLNAISESHWRFWEQFLKTHPQVTFVCKEFQTGLRAREPGAVAYEKILRLRDRVGRSLHPILIAGQRFLPKLQRDFGSSFTIIDATPFLKTYHRQLLRGMTEDGFKWRFKRTAKGEFLDGRLLQIIRDYEAALREKAASKKEIQTELALRGILECRRKTLPLQQPQEDWELFRPSAEPARPAPPTSPAYERPPLQIPSRIGLTRRRSEDSFDEVEQRLNAPKL